MTVARNEDGSQFIAFSPVTKSRDGIDNLQRRTAAPF
jgi:hypothetical protein